MDDIERVLTCLVLERTATSRCNACHRFLSYDISSPRFSKFDGALRFFTAKSLPLSMSTTSPTVPNVPLPSLFVITYRKSVWLSASGGSKIYSPISISRAVNNGPNKPCIGDTGDSTGGGSSYRSVERSSPKDERLRGIDGVGLWSSGVAGTDGGPPTMASTISGSSDTSHTIGNPTVSLANWK